MCFMTELLRYVQFNSLCDNVKEQTTALISTGMNKVYCYGIPTTKPPPGRLFEQTMGIFKQHLEIMAHIKMTGHFDTT